MNRIITASPSLPGTYCHDDSNGATSSSSLSAYQHDSMVEPTQLNNMAIISPIFFSPSLSPGSLRTSLPGTWVDSSPFQLKQEKDINNEKGNNHTLANSHRHYHQRYHNHHHLQQQQQKQQQQQQQQQQQSISVSPPSPGTSTSSSSSSSSPILDHVDMNHLRETIASLKERAKQLEQTDLVVKKSIEIVAKKRLIAHHQRRQHSQWDWCDQPNDNYVTTDDQGNINTGVPVLDDLDDDADSDEEHDHDGCGGDWEWID